MINKTIVITGPTGVGKTDISLEIAKMYDCEIINADASQFKRDLNIGTAKIDLNTTDVIHHFVDIIDATSSYNISDYQKEGRLLIDEIKRKGHTPLIVGGSGLYINSLLYDYHFSSDKEDDFDFSPLSNEELWQELSTLDKETADKIPINNRRRLERALSKARIGNKISDNLDGDKLLYDAVIICLNTDRETLYNRINKRVDIMLDNGLVSECEELMKKGYDLSKITDIGYLECFKYLNGECSYVEMAETIKKRTRNYAKRQLTWFRNKLKPVYVNVNYDDINKTIMDIKNIIEEGINK